MIVGPENKAAVDEINRLIQRETQEIAHIPAAKLWEYIAAQAIIQKKAREYIWEYPIKPQVDGELDSRLPRLKTFTKYAMAVYGVYWAGLRMKTYLVNNPTTTQVISKYCGIDADNISEFPSTQSFPAHAVIVDHANKAIVLAIRGSISNYDWITDFSGDYIPHTLFTPEGQPLESGVVHEGIFKAAHGLIANTKGIILKRSWDNPGHSLVITGHSLGAGTAAMLGLIWYSDP